MLWMIGNAAAGPGEEQLQEVTVTALRLSLIGSAQTASEGVVVDDELTLTPAYRPGQLLETVPGLDVTIHSGEGKANQYLMRGYNLDHGTDLALFVDDMPVNDPTHAHGQGYADLNFVMPELATNVSYTKGTYYADEGDFASVGSVHINYLDRIPPQLSATVGSLDFQRALSVGSVSLANGSLLGALELQHYDGPWTTPGDQRKVNAVLRFSSGDAQRGFSITGMFYHDIWNAQTDQPQRALTEGLIPSVYGILDPSDAGYAQRASLSMLYRRPLGDGEWTSNAYVITNRMSLWNDFTHFLVDPVDGDQERQHEDRTTVGADTRYVRGTRLFGFNTELMIGLHSRFDFNDVSRIPTHDRVPLTVAQLAAVDYPTAYSEIDRVRLSAVAGFVQLMTPWTERLRSVLGFREDYTHGGDTGTNHGSASQAMPEPKVSLIYRLDPSTELYASFGRGFHSDDLRGVTQASILHLPGAPLMASQTGEELGLRQELFGDRVSLTIALYELLAQSETEYDPDIGQDFAGRGSRRDGYEINLTYQVQRWLEFYGSFSADHARYTSPLDDGTGHLGNYLPNAPSATGSFNIYIRNLGRWSGGIAYRYLGAFPLTSGPCVDSAVRTDFPGLTSCPQAPTPKGQLFGSGYGEWSADLRYAFGTGWSLGAAIFNLLDRKANAMEYFYVDRLPGEPSYGIADLHLHPLEPISARITVSKTF